MWTDAVLSTNWALAWFILSLASFIFARQLASNPGKQLRARFGRSAWLILPAVALIVRLVPAILLPVGAGYDIDSFRLTAGAITGGEDVYTSAAAGRHPYLPFQMYFIGLALSLSQTTAIPFVVLVKLLPIAADAVITGLIWFAATKDGAKPQFAWWLALLYAFNPVSVLVSAYHGQFDSIAILLLLAAWFFWHFGRRLSSSSLFLGFAILNKTWPVIFLPIVLLRLKRIGHIIIYGIVALAVPVSLTAAYVFLLKTDPSPMLRRALTHSGVGGWWGISGILAIGGNYLKFLAGAADQYHGIRVWILAAAGGLALWHTRRQATLDALVTILLAIFAVTAGMGLQWLLWVVPFAILARDITWLRRYSLAALILMIPHLYGIHLMTWAYSWLDGETVDLVLTLAALPVWIVVIFWLIARWREDKVSETYQPAMAASSNRLLMFLAAFMVLVSAGWLAWQVGDLALSHPNRHTDNLYNQGVIYRSALFSSSEAALESSYLHWYFEEQELVKPEDWHRGISLLIQKQVIRLFPSGSEQVVRLPHLFWVAAWLGIAAFLTTTIVRKRFAGRYVVFSIAGVVALLILNRWSPEVLSGAFLDDVPGAFFALLGTALLFSPPLDPRRAAAAAAAFGFAFLAKDFYLIWAGIGWILVLLSWLRDPDRKLKKLLVGSVVYFTVLLLIYSPKVIWNLSDLDQPLSTAARTALNSRLVPERDEHYIFSFTGEEPPDSYWSIVRSTGLIPIISKGLANTARSFLDLWHSWILVIMVMPLFLLYRRTNPLLSRLLAVLFASLAAYVFLFVFQLGEPTQFRYWLVPLTLGVVFSVAVIAAAGSHSWQVDRPHRLLLPVLITIFVVFAISFNEFRRQQNSTFAHGPPYSPEIENLITSGYREGSAVLLHTNRGVHIWARNPQLQVASVKPWLLNDLSAEQFDDFINTYDIASAAISAEYSAALELLESAGFVEEKRIENDVFLTRQQLGRDIPFNQTNIPGLGIVRSSLMPPQQTEPGSMSIAIKWAVQERISEDLDVCFNVTDETGRSLGYDCYAWGENQDKEKQAVPGVVEQTFNLDPETFRESGSYNIYTQLRSLGLGGESDQLFLVDHLERELDSPLGVRWDEAISLDRLDYEEANEWLQLTFYWQANDFVSESYKVFVHVIDQGTGQIAVQYDAVPVEWSRPTTSWEPGEIIQDQILLSLEDIPPGSYRVQAGFYDPETGERLAVFASDGERFPEDSILLHILER